MLGFCLAFLAMEYTALYFRKTGSLIFYICVENPNLYFHDLGVRALVDGVGIG
jgi:hypothetical protein